MKTHRGTSFPLGATFSRAGVNFSVYSKNATGVELLFFNHVDDSSPSAVVALDRFFNHTADYWHVFVEDLKPGQIYAYRVDGPYDPPRGFRFDASKVLLDPYGLSVTYGARYSRAAAARPGQNAGTAMKSVVADLSTYDWEDDAPLRTPFAHTVIYELHVGGFTKHPSSGVSPEKRGTYAGLIEKIPYLHALGITAVELLPIFQFDPQDAPDHLPNYWGYSPVSFFAPHLSYSSSSDPLACLNEFRDMIKALHCAGIEVILDVVYNHSAEGSEGGPTLSFRGFESETYYILDSTKQHYADYTGCGNTLNANHSVVRRMIRDSVSYWVEQMHVDGLRFDLASILSRDENGAPMSNPPIIWDLDSDPVLASTKLIAEAWDAAGLYQVGDFIGDNWKEWNGKFRDDMRMFAKATPGSVTRARDRLLGSPDLYGKMFQLQLEKSINFVSCHDGFTLNDLVSYNEKHNLANHENNRDGAVQNFSWNCGVEGPTDDQAVCDLRLRQMKNLLTATLLSIGVPMIQMGDELSRTQNGNNNAYCQDNPSNWLDWSLVEKNAGLHRFVSSLIVLRREFAVSGADRGLTLTEFASRAQIQWHGIRLNRPDWGENSFTLALTSQNIRGGRIVYFVWNSYWEPLEFQLPMLPNANGEGWSCLVDTSQPSPADISLKNPRRLVEDRHMVAPRSIMLLAWTAPESHKSPDDPRSASNV